jgi:hypothetical protein
MGFKISRLCRLNTNGSTNFVDPPSALTIPSPVPDPRSDEKEEEGVNLSVDLDLNLGLRGSTVGRDALPKPIEPGMVDGP